VLGSPRSDPASYWQADRKARALQAASRLPILTPAAAEGCNRAEGLRAVEMGVLVRSLLWITLAMSLVWPAFAVDATTRLVAATAAGKTSVVRDLLVQGVDANTKNGTGRPVLVLAGFNGNRRTALVLLAAGADVNAVDSTGTSALMAASAFGHKELVDLLLVAGADANLKDVNGRSALSRAELGGHSEVVETLKAAGAVETDAADAKPN